MSPQTGRDQAYVMGYSEHETRRLLLQAKILGDLTRRTLLSAGVGSGMSVLDIGCGPGDVSLLAAEIVGPTGSVTGLDRDPHALDIARKRAQHGGFANVSFIEGDASTLHLSLPLRFDAIVGRLILIHIPDRTACLRDLAVFLNPGGVFAFVDVDLTQRPPTSPLLHLYPIVYFWLYEAFQRAGLERNMGLKMSGFFTGAGLPAPEVRFEHFVSQGLGSPMHAWLAETLRTLMPVVTGSGLATAAEVDIDTLGERLQAEAAATNAALVSACMVSAWTRLPD